MWIEDYYSQGKRCFFWLHKKGGRRYNVVPAHHWAQVYVDAYLKAAELEEDREGTAVPELPTRAAGPGDDRWADVQRCAVCICLSQVLLRWLLFCTRCSISRPNFCIAPGHVIAVNITARCAKERRRV